MKKLFVAVAAIASAILVPAALMAWGPERPTFTVANPANHVTFNSITDNPNIGDERNFVGIREAGTNNLWSDNMNVQEGKSYVVRMYVHNNAADNLNLVAQNVTAKFNLPTTTGKSLQVNGFLSSSNATPQEVYDHAIFKSDRDFNLAYQTGTLKFENNHFGAAGTPISESVFTNAGAKLGYDKLDGKIPGCFQYAGYLSFIVTPQFGGKVNFDISKQVRKSGETEWKKSVAAKPGETVEYQLSYKNTSNVSQSNVWMRDTLPNGLSYNAGTSFIKNAANPNSLKLSDNLTTQTGINIGNYTAGSNAFVKFSAKVNDDPNLKCGIKTMTNKIRVTVDGNYKEDTADVTITKPCAPGETPVTELPQTGISGGAALAGIGILTAGLVYALRSTRVRNLLRG